MIEVEIKLPIPEADNLKAKLLNLGFRENGFLQEHDTYFDNPEGSIRANGQALRVRVTKDPGTGKSSAQINFKGKKLDRQTAARQELETGVEDGAVCREILRAIGYVPVTPEVRKDRRMLCMDQVTACLDRVDGLGDFLELEILVEREEERDAAVGRIEGILGHLGYRLSDTTRTSYLSMLQKKYSGV